MTTNTVFKSQKEKKKLKCMKVEWYVLLNWALLFMKKFSL
jgi:hypothetical protein